MRFCTFGFWASIFGCRRSCGHLFLDTIHVAWQGLEQYYTESQKVTSNQCVSYRKDCLIYDIHAGNCGIMAWGVWETFAREEIKVKAGHTCWNSV